MKAKKSRLKAKNIGLTYLISNYFFMKKINYFYWRRKARETKSQQLFVSEPRSHQRVNTLYSVVIFSLIFSPLFAFAATDGKFFLATSLDLGSSTTIDEVKTYVAGDIIDLPKYGFSLTMPQGFEAKFDDDQALDFTDLSDENSSFAIVFFEVPQKWNTLQVATYFNKMFYYIYSSFYYAFGGSSDKLKSVLAEINDLDYEDSTILGRTAVSTNVPDFSEVSGDKSEIIYSHFLAENGIVLAFLETGQKTYEKFTPYISWNTKPLTTENYTAKVSVEAVGDFFIDIKSPWIHFDDSLLGSSLKDVDMIVNDKDPGSYLVYAESDPYEKSYEGMLSSGDLFQNIKTKDYVIEKNGQIAKEISYEFVGNKIITRYISKPKIIADALDKDFSISLIMVGLSEAEEQTAISDYNLAMNNIIFEPANTDELLKKQQSEYDAKIVADIKQIQTALELYFNDHGAYPLTSTTIALGSGNYSCLGDDGFTLASCLPPYYMRNLPSSPNSSNPYYYHGLKNQYYMDFTLSAAVGNLPAGPNCATENGIIGGVCVKESESDIIVSRPVRTDYINSEKSLVSQASESLIESLKGRILLQVQEHGEAWYVDPASSKKYYLQDGVSAYDALRKFGLGITNENLAKIPIGIEDRFEDIDSDNDGLPDKLEEAITTSSHDADTDDDGFNDGVEVKSGYNPLGTGKIKLDLNLANSLKGKILLQVQSKGEAWYVNPADGKRYYMKDGDSAYQIMRFLSLGITNENLRKIPVGDL